MAVKRKCETCGQPLEDAKNFKAIRDELAKSRDAHSEQRAKAEEATADANDLRTRLEHTRNQLKRLADHHGVPEEMNGG